MNYKRDYNLMINDQYIQDKGVYQLEINTLQNKLKKEESVTNALNIMTEISIYKRALTTGINYQNVKDVVNPDNVYIHARSSVSIPYSNVRFWVSHYVGKKDEMKRNSWKQQANIAVMNKVIDKLKTLQL
jgi:hypothetical protein